MGKAHNVCVCLKNVTSWAKNIKFIVLVLALHVHITNGDIKINDGSSEVAKQVCNNILDLSDREKLGSNFVSLREKFWFKILDFCTHYLSSSKLPSKLNPTFAWIHLFLMIITVCGEVKTELEQDKTQQNDMCTQQRLRSAWAAAQSDQIFHCPHEETLGP